MGMQAGLSLQGLWLQGRRFDSEIFRLYFSKKCLRSYIQIPSQNPSITSSLPSPTIPTPGPPPSYPSFLSFFLSCLSFFQPPLPPPYLRPRSPNTYPTDTCLRRRVQNGFLGLSLGASEVWRFTLGWVCFGLFCLGWGRGGVGVVGLGLGVVSWRCDVNGISLL